MGEATSGSTGAADTAAAGSDTAAAGSDAAESGPGGQARWERWLHGASARWQSHWEQQLRRWDKNRVFALAHKGWDRSMELNLATHVLALAAQQILCTAPLIVAFAAFQHDSRNESIGSVLSRYLGLSSGAAHDVTQLFTASRNIDVDSKIIGLLVALVFATSIAVTQQRWYERVWAVPRAGAVVSIFRQLLWVAGLCAYLVLVLYAGRAGHGVGRHVHANRPSGPFAQVGVSFLFLWWSQHLLLGDRVSWRRLAPGAACMAIGTGVVVTLSGLWMSSEIVTESGDYGLIGTTFVLSVWLLGMSGVLFGGALIGELISERHSYLSGQHT